MSKSVTAPVLKIIQDTIAEQRMTITKEEAVVLFRHEIPEYIKVHGKQPELSDPNPNVRRLAEAITFVRNAKIRHMLKLESEKKGGES